MSGTESFRIHLGAPGAAGPEGEEGSAAHPGESSGSMRVSLDAGLFVQVLKAINELIDEPTLHFAPEIGMTVKMLNENHVMAVETKLEPEAFYEYQVNSDTSIAFNAERLITLIGKKVPARNRIELEVNEETKMIYFRVIDNSGICTKTVVLQQLEPMPLPNFNLTFDAAAVVNADELYRQIKVMPAYDVEIVLEGEKLVLISKSDTESLETVLQATPVKDNNARARYGCIYLLKALKVRPADDVIIALSDQKPLKLEYDVGLGKIAYYIAPRGD